MCVVGFSSMVFCTEYLFHLDIKGSVRRTNVSNSNQNDVYQSPDPETAEAKQLSDSLLPVSEIKPEKNYSIKNSVLNVILIFVTNCTLTLPNTK